MSDKKKLTIRNDANDLLVFVKENGGDGVDVLVADENVWLTQKLMCQLYESSKSNISEHLTTIFTGGELDENSAVRNFRTTASDGKMYDQKYYGDYCSRLQGQFAKGDTIPRMGGGRAG